MTPFDDPYELLTRQQVAEILHCHVSHVTTLTKKVPGHRPQLLSIRTGRRVMIPRAALHAYIRGEDLDVSNAWPPTAPMFGLDGEPC